MTEEDEIKLHARFAVIEMMITMLWGFRHLETGDPASSMGKLRNTLMEKARNKTYPAFGAALGPERGAAYSDVYAAEVEAALDRLLKEQEKLLGRITGQVPEA
jgi:hypothetical protein